MLFWSFSSADKDYLMNRAQILPNFIAGQRVVPTNLQTSEVISPCDEQIIAQVPLSTAREVDAAVQAAAKVQPAWAAVPVKERIQVFFRLKQLIEENIELLATCVVAENGKTLAEAKGSIARGIECIEFATSLPQTASGEILQVGRGVTCESRQVPLGVVCGITPFNFPLMVPLWMVPAALACGNAFILKPSEQTPMSSLLLADLLMKAGLPAGIFSVVHGGRLAVEALCDHKGISAIGFVGSSAVAEAVYQRGTAAGKAVRALGGAKNHLILMPDANADMAVENIVASATGCAGQRCMAASVLLAVGNVDPMISRIREKMAALVPGKDLGPVISRAALQGIKRYIAEAESHGAALALDGRKAHLPKAGYYIGASLIDRASPAHPSACEEIFGPVLTVIRCHSLEDALRIENASPYGNAAAIYTQSGEIAQQFSDKASAGMLGINVGVPVPREPFAFGGWHRSRFGEGDLTGRAGLAFWSKTQKITSKWCVPTASSWMS
jgi:malonate-semialdehyde dehydrogenase (acetylating)/methylmalonate-semialdehyde dehydrogenase